MADTASKTYDPSLVEEKWYEYWKSRGYFHSDPDERTPYTVVIPPPNVTGVLHMGHMLNNTIQDVLVRRKRMQGFNACWVPGIDHASIATEAKVVAMLREKGIKKSDLTRDEFLKHAWEWKEKYGGVILKQLERLGAGCDWRRTRFTMEPKLSQAVVDVFVDLHQKGLIYRGWRMIHWDPAGKTALSDEEVVRKDVKGKLYYVLYRFEDEGVGPSGERGLVVATTRPETFFADTAVAVHPEDSRYQDFWGRRVRVPASDRLVPIIADSAVDPAFGTGCLKVTPAHDILDYEIGQRHGLETLVALDEDGHLNQLCGKYAGMDRFEAREAVAKELIESGLCIKVEEVIQSIGFSERTHAVVEPRLSLQWFVSMKPLAEKALRPVLEGEIKLIPERFVNTYRHWMENVRDWCISRQLWWGHRIPVYYFDLDGEERFVVARNEREAWQKARDAGYQGNDLRQDPDVLDTWFSSWLWPISVFDGFENSEDFKYYYPTDDLVTAPEILFFWVARMIMAGYEYTGKRPFKNVYLTGIVRDKLGRKMSKSLGNSPDPLDLIARYGADGVRVGMLLCSPAGNDLLFDEALCEQGRNFANKIWNAFRLFKSWETRLEDSPPSAVQNFHLRRMEIETEYAAARLQDHFDKYRMSDALMTVYKLFWDDFCSTFLEGVKTRAAQSRTVYERTAVVFERLLQLLHPFMPFITEELWHALRNRTENESIVISRLAPPASFDVAERDAIEWTLEGLNAIERTMQVHKFSSKEEVRLFVCPIKPGYDPSVYRSVFEECFRLAEFVVGTKPEVEKLLPAGPKLSDTAPGFVFYLYPVSVALDSEAERRRLTEELRYLEGFLKSVESKLNNEKFLANAKPEIVARERQKYADAVAKIEALKRALD
ncbi:MAG: valine--tRNA ligase [Bacteroidia bacterium]|nr:valine--tRNA ligase [Bacteroidia bacterium]